MDWFAVQITELSARKSDIQGLKGKLHSFSYSAAQ